VAGLKHCSQEESAFAISMEFIGWHYIKIYSASYAELFVFYLVDGFTLAWLCLESTIRKSLRWLRSALPRASQLNVTPPTADQPHTGSGKCNRNLVCHWKTGKFTKTNRNSTVFWNVTPWGLVDICRRFGDTVYPLDNLDSTARKNDYIR
jgi:hypothetical protein